MSKVVHQHGSSQDSGSLVGVSWGTKPVQSLLENRKSDSSASSNVLVISGEDYVSIYSSPPSLSSETVCLKTWSIAQSKKSKGRKNQIAVPARLLPGTCRVICVDSENGLLSWDYFQESLHLPEQSVCNLGQSKACLMLSTKKLKGVAVLVFQDGSVAIVNEKAQVKRELADASNKSTKGKSGKHQQQKKKSGNVTRVVNAALVERASSRRNKWDLVLAVVVENKLEFRIFTVSENEINNVVAQELAPSSENKDVRNVIIHSSHLATVLWSDGTAQVIYLHRSSPFETIADTSIVELLSSSSSTSNEVAKPKRKKRTRTASTSSAASTTSIVDTSSTLLPVCKAQDSMPVLLVGSERRVVTWDAKLGVSLTHVDLTSAPLFLELEDSKEIVAVGLENGDVVVIDTAGKSPAGLGNISGVSTLAGALERSLKRRKVSSPGEIPLACPKVVQFVDPETFDEKEWQNMMQKAEDEANKALETILSKKAQLKDKVHTFKLNANSFQFREKVVHSLLESKSWEVLEALLRERAISYKANPQLVKTLLENNKLDLLFLSIKTVADLDEQAIVQVLQHLIGRTSTTALASFAGQVENHDSDGSDIIVAAHNPIQKKRMGLMDSLSHSTDKSENEARVNDVKKWLSKFLTDAERGIQYMIMAILLAPKNNVFMIDAVKRMDDAVAKSVLFAICNLVDFYASLPMRENTILTVPGKTSLDMVVPGLNVCLHWFAIALDAGFTTIASRPDKEFIKVMERMHSLVTSQAEIADYLQRTKFPLRYATSKNPASLLPAAQLADYVVETVEF